MSCPSPVSYYGQMVHTANGNIAFVGETGDGRKIDSYEFRQFPLTLRAVFADRAGPHENAVPVGKITSAKIRGDAVFAEMEFADTAHGRYAAKLADDEILTGISIDGADVREYEVTWEVVDEAGTVIDVDFFDIPMETMEENRWRVRTVFERVVIAAATLVATPAFPEARITYTGDGFAEGEGDAPDAPKTPDMEIMASSHLPIFPALGFEKRTFTAPTAIQFEEITAADGETWAILYGHVAPWNEPHLASLDGNPIILRKNDFSCSMFNKGEVLLDNGERVWTGFYTVGKNHGRPVNRNQPLSNAQLLEHYDDPNSAGAIIHAYNEAHGVAICGIVPPWADLEQVMQAMTAPPSVHARRTGGVMTLYGVLGVCIPGYAVERGQGGTVDAEDSYHEIAASWAPINAAAESRAERLNRAIRLNQIDLHWKG